MEYNNLPAKRLNDPGGEDKPQIFRTLRNIDLNLLTIFEAVYVHKGIVNAAKILRKVRISRSFLPKLTR